jgi:phage terminase large subunit-like protein/ribosomal protein S27AE
VFALTEKQQDAQQVLAGQARHVLGKGGARSGKTFLFIRAIFIRALRTTRSRHVALRFRGNAARSSLWLDTIPSVSTKCFPNLPLRYHEKDGYIEFPNKAQLWVGGLDDRERVEKILGQEHATIFFNECSQIRWSTVPIVLTRLAQRCPGLKNRAYYDLNPVGKTHWTYKLFTQHVSPDTGKSIPDPGNYAQFRINPTDNRSNVDAEFIQSLEGLPERQRLRFLEGQDQDDAEGQLWTIEMLELCRVERADVPTLKRIVVAVDPSGDTGLLESKHDAIGICVVGLGTDGHVYILEDATGSYSPEGWGKKVVELYRKHKADCVLGEANFGGDMVRAVVHGVVLPDGYLGRNLKYKAVTASRGKVVRAEPVASRYEQGLVHHVGEFPELENELQNFRQGEYMGEKSPNAADAAIWGVTEFLDGPAFGLLEFWKKEAEEIGKDKQLQIRPLPDAQELADAQKRDIDKMQTPKKLGKIATAPQQTNVCPGCGNKFLSRFTESWKCGACGASGKNEKDARCTAS